MKNPQNLTLFQKKNLNFVISKFQKFFKHSFFYKVEARLEVSLGRKFKKKYINTDIEIEAKNRPNCYDFNPLTMRYITIHRVLVGHFSLSLKLKNLNFGVASNQLKIRQQVVYEEAVNHTRGFFTRQESCGFRAI